MANDYDDDDRPRRRPRDEDYDDRPRRNRDDDAPRRPRGDDYDEDRGERDTAPAKRKVSLLGVFSLIGGVLSLIVALIPCVGLIAIGPAVLAGLLGLIGIFVAGSNNHGKGLPIAGTIVNVLAVGVAVLMTTVFVNKAGKVEDQQREAELATGEAIKIQASKLGDEFETNVVNAEAKYKGKLLEVTGKVKMVSKERIGKITVEIGDNNNTIDCDFGSSKKEELVGVDIGKKVTIRGFCKGVDRRSKYVILESCVLVKDAAPPPVPGKAVPAEAGAVTKAYGENEVSADEKYQGKLLELSGKVARVVKGDGTITVFVRGGGEEDFEEIACEFDKSAADALKKFTVDKAVKLTGTCEGRKDGQITLTGCSVAK